MLSNSHNSNFQAILADLPPYGRISNLEPFFAYVRAGRLSLAQLKAILTHLGYSEVPDPSTAIAENKIASVVKNYLQDWKEKNVGHNVRTTHPVSL